MSLIRSAGKVGMLVNNPTIQQSTRFHIKIIHCSRPRLPLVMLLRFPFVQDAGGGSI